MTAIAERIAAAAHALAGVPFRLHGRDPAIGLDCVGLALLSAREAGLLVPEPAPYRLRSGAGEQFVAYMEEAGFRLSSGRQAGDVLLIRLSALQSHLAVDAGDAVVHAHAGLGRVVVMPPDPQWQLQARWRFSPDHLQDRTT
jgi:lipoprotein Spr